MHAIRIEHHYWFYGNMCMENIVGIPNFFEMNMSGKTHKPSPEGLQKSTN